MISKKVEFNCPIGMQVKPAGEICKAAVAFSSTSTLVFDGGTSNAKSMLSVLGSGLRFGQEVEIVCDGTDEENALQTLCDLIENQSNFLK